MWHPAGVHKALKRKNIVCNIFNSRTLFAATHIHDTGLPGMDQLMKLLKMSSYKVKFAHSILILHDNDELIDIFNDIV